MQDKSEDEYAAIDARHRKQLVNEGQRFSKYIQPWLDEEAEECAKIAEATLREFTVPSARWACRATADKIRARIKARQKA